MERHSKGEFILFFVKELKLFDLEFFYDHELLCLSCGFPAEFRNDNSQKKLKKKKHGTFLLPDLLPHMVSLLFFVKFSLILFHSDFATVSIKIKRKCNFLIMFNVSNGIVFWKVVL